MAGEIVGQAAETAAHGGVDLLRIVVYGDGGGSTFCAPPVPRMPT